MRTIIFLIIMLFQSELKAQITIDTLPWCPPGATWIYRSFSATSRLYYKFSYSRDTTIDNKFSKVLSVDEIQYIGVLPTLVRTSEWVGDEYLYEENDSVYWYDKVSNDFKFIYSFNPSIGDTFIVGNSRAYCLGDTSYPHSDTFIVSSLETDTINSRILNRYNTASLTGNYTIGVIFSKIGSAPNPFPEINRFNCISSTAEYGEFYEELVCYTDSLRGNLQFSNLSSEECHDISTYSPDHAKIKMDNLLVYPNPTSDELYIDQLGIFPSKYFIYNIQGQCMAEGEMHDQVISTKGLQQGIYLLKITDREGNNQIVRFIKM